MAYPPSLQIIKGILILDNDGKRLVAKYYDDQFASVKEQKEFERTLFVKTQKANGEIIMLNNMTIVYRSSIDLYFYVIGSINENEILLVSILNCIYDTMSIIVRKSFERKYFLRNMDMILLAIDEICDSGVLLEVDSARVMERINLRDNDSLSEQTIVDVFKIAKEQFKNIRL
jgi:coatomer subunit zeta